MSSFSRPLRPENIPISKKDWAKNFPYLSNGRNNSIDEFIRNNELFYNLNSLKNLQGKTELSTGNYGRTADKIISILEDNQIIDTFSKGEQMAFGNHIELIFFNSIAYSLTFAIIRWMEQKHLIFPNGWTVETFYKQMFVQSWEIYLKEHNKNRDICESFSEVIPQSLYEEFNLFVNRIIDKYNDLQGDLQKLADAIIENYKEKFAIYERQNKSITYLESPIVRTLSNISKGKQEIITKNGRKESRITWSEDKFTITATFDNPLNISEEEQKMLIAISKFFYEKYNHSLDKKSKKEVKQDAESKNIEIISVTPTKYSLEIPFKDLKAYVLQNWNYKTKSQKYDFIKKISDIIEKINNYKVKLEYKADPKNRTGNSKKGLILSKRHRTLIEDEDYFGETLRISISINYAIHLLIDCQGVTMPKNAFKLTKDAWSLAMFINPLLTNYGNMFRNNPKRAFLVSTLLSKCQCLPTYEKLKNTIRIEKSSKGKDRKRSEARRWKAKIYKPFVKAMDQLIKAEVIEDYDFALEGVENAKHIIDETKILKGTELEEQLKSYDTFSKLRVLVYKPINLTPDDKKKIEKYRINSERKKARNKKKT